MKKWIHRNATVVIVVTTVAICAWLFYKNHVHEDFWVAQITDIITVLFACLITVFVSERGSNIRKRNECIKQIIDDIETFIANEDNFFSPNGNQEVFIKQTSCANRIKYLKDASIPELEEDIDFISSQFEVIRDLYSNHYQQENGLELVRKDFDKHRTHIIDKCNKMRIELYK